MNAKLLLLPQIFPRLLIFIQARQILSVNGMYLFARLDLRGEMRLVGSKILRAGVFAWATLIAVIISNSEAMVTPMTQFHFIITSVLAPSSTLFAALSAYILNDLSDIEIDRINSPKRLLVTKNATKADAIVLIVILDFGALLTSSALGYLPFLIILLEIVGGFAYSFRPARYEGRFVLKTLSIGIAGAVSSLFGAIALGFGISLNVVYAAGVFFMYLFATSPMNDLIDKFGDKAAKRRTIPIVIGDKNTLRLSMIASMIPFISSVALTSLHRADILMPMILAFVGLRSVQLLLPLLKEYNQDTLKKAHRQMITFHFILQAAILIGFIRFL